MTIAGDQIHHHLEAVAHERHLRHATPGLEAQVVRLKAYQQARFARTHADLLGHPRYQPTARFFLDELYGPRDFSSRDAQFARIVPGLVKLFPQEFVTTVATLTDLHALSERLDTGLARHLPAAPAIDRGAYVLAWQASGDPAGRKRQIDLVLNVGQALDRYTRNPLLRGTLRVMRGPARAAGLASLQAFLEAGFDAFAGMRGATEFLRSIEARERALAERLFAPDAPAAAGQSPVTDALLGQLP